MNDALPNSNFIASSNFTKERVVARHPRRCFIIVFRPDFEGAWHRRWCSGTFATDQVIRAATSVPATLSEGHGRFGRDRFKHWRIAYGSAREVDTFLRLLADAGVVDRAQTGVAIDLFDQVRAMTWRLLHPMS